MKLAILVCTWNRKALTEKCVGRLAETCQGSPLVVVDDASTDYDVDWLLGIGATFVLRRKTHLGGSWGIARNRLLGMEHILAEHPEVEWIYNTDSDCFHDVGWLLRLEDMVRTLPQYHVFSLYNSCIQARRSPMDLEQENDMVRRLECPGASLAVRADLLRMEGSPFKITEDNVKHKLAWDHCIARVLANNIAIVSKTSYVEHLGNDPEAMHYNKNPKWWDRALNPTEELSGLLPQPLNDGYCANCGHWATSSKTE